MPSRARKSCNELSNKVSKMLAWARMDITGLKREPIDLAEIAVAAAAQLRPLGHERGISIEVGTTGEAVTSGDGGLIKEAIHNMIENAIKHTPAGSHVVVTSGPGPRISVADNGAGFPKVDGLLLLQPFWKGDANTAGAGLGLALVKRVADSHGARVLLGSSQDGGAEICLNFRPPQAARA
jgi:signal transduction histidine kinase